MPPPMEGFRPFGMSLRKPDEIILLFEEYEAIRLADYEDLTQEEAACRMEISRPTFTRLYEKARKKIAQLFIEGKTLVIRGGFYITDDYWFRCFDCKEVMITLKPVNTCRHCNSENIQQINASSKKT